MSFNFERFPILTTERLRLREISVDDAADIFAIRSDAYVQRFNAPLHEDVEESRAFILRQVEAYSDRENILWGVTLREKTTVMGMIGFGGWDQHHRRATLGYDFARKYWGKGYATEAAQALLRFGFGQMALHRIEAPTIRDNTESVSLLNRLGFKLEGYRREFSWEDDGIFHDSAMFALLEHEHTHKLR